MALLGLLLDHRADPQVMVFVNGKALKDYATRGNAAPDHSIRIKRFGVVLPAPDANDLAKWTIASKFRN